MNFELLKTVCVVAIAGSIITTPTVQKIKEGFNFKNSKTLVWVSLAVSMLLGTTFSLCFSELSIINSLWAGFVTWLGAEAIYLALEEKVFTPFKDMQKDDVTELPRGDEDND